MAIRQRRHASTIRRMAHQAIPELGVGGVGAGFYVMVALQELLLLSPMLICIES